MLRQSEVENTSQRNCRYASVSTNDRTMSAKTSNLNGSIVKSLARRFWDAQMNDIKNYHFWKSSVAEFIAVFWLVLFIVGSGCVRPESEPASLVLVALGIICTVTIIVVSVVNTNINPAISVMLALTNRITVIRAVFYSFFHCLGGVCAYLLLQQMLPSSMTANLGVPKPANDVTSGQAFSIELTLGFFIGFACLSMFDTGRTDKWGELPFIFALCIASNFIFVGGVTPLSMNPAFSVGPMVVFGDTEYQWIYIFGPIIGQAIGAVIYDLFFSVDVSNKWDRIIFKRNNTQTEADANGLETARDKIKREESQMELCVDTNI